MGAHSKLLLFLRATFTRTYNPPCPLLPPPSIFFSFLSLPCSKHTLLLSENAVGVLFDLLIIVFGHDCGGRERESMHMCVCVCVCYKGSVHLCIHMQCDRKTMVLCATKRVLCIAKTVRKNRIVVVNSLLFTFRDVTKNFQAHTKCIFQHKQAKREKLENLCRDAAGVIHVKNICKGSYVRFTTM